MKRWSRGGEQYRFKHLPIPLYIQEDSHACGYWCALSVMHHFNKDTSYLYLKLGVTADGTRQHRLVKTLRKSGMSANVVRRKNKEDFYRAIDKDKPVIVYHHTVEHWMIMNGYCQDTNEILLYCPERGSVAQSADVIDGYLNNFGIVCGNKRYYSDAVNVDHYRAQKIKAPSEEGA